MSRGTTLRNVRVDDDLWDAAKERAGANGEDVSKVVRRALALYLDDEARDLIHSLLDAHDDEETLEDLGSSMAVRARAFDLI